MHYYRNRAEAEGRHGIKRLSLAITGAAVAILCGCATPAPAVATQETPKAVREFAERDVNLSAKIRCANEGRKFFEADRGSPLPGEHWDARFSYSPEMNTCLCEEIITVKLIRSKHIIDVLTNRTVAEYLAVSINPSKRTKDDADDVAAFEKIESVLFPEPEAAEPGK